MNILLVAINAKYIHSNLAVYSLKSYAKKYQGHIRIAEFTINHRVNYILQEIYKQHPDALCFSCYIWNFRYVQELAAEIHKLLPGLPIWAGRKCLMSQKFSWKRTLRCPGCCWGKAKQRSRNYAVIIWRKEKGARWGKFRV